VTEIADGAQPIRVVGKHGPYWAEQEYKWLRLVLSRDNIRQGETSMTSLY
jgi:hypothetical protein